MPLARSVTRLRWWCNGMSHPCCIVAPSRGDGVCHDGSLLNDFHMSRYIFLYLFTKQRIVGATQDDCVDVGTLRHEGVNIFLDKIVGAWPVTLSVLDQRHPHGARVAVDFYVGKHLPNLDVIRETLHCSRCAKDAHVAGCGEIAYLLHGWADNTQHPAIGVDAGEVTLLNGAQRLGRGSVARKYHELAALIEQVLDRLQRELVNELIGAVAVGCSRIVAQEDVVILWKHFANLSQDG